MPFLRFSRDKRGYANTYLCHTFREDGSLRMRVLYWFRTPPDIAVGRPALDDEAIRDIEASNPGLSFDWEEILKAKPPAVPPDRGGQERKERRSRRRGRGVTAGSDGAGAGAAAISERSAEAKAGSEATAATGSERPAGDSPVTPDETTGAPVARSGRRRRRRRRRGGGAGEQRSAPAAVLTPASPAEPDSDPA